MGDAEKGGEGEGDRVRAGEKIRVGVCAMDKKARSKPMTAVLDRLMALGDFDLVIFGDETILHAPVEDWPVVDCLVSFFSTGFPLEKAEQYVELRRPFMVNDVKRQRDLLDRRQVYEILRNHGVPCPDNHVVNREELVDHDADPDYFEELEESILVHGAELKKPFVEKPVDAEDHNIYIYYPDDMGGGVKSLFRKKGDRSSEYLPDHTGSVRRGGSFMYERFMQTGGTDVKVYTVGPHYAHAEARKSPVLDGRVQRTPDGKEERYPVLLSPAEKEIARTVCLAFGQNVCGFDLLRSQGRSFVCDVNGWSFVKNSEKYYDDCAKIFRTMIMTALVPSRLQPSLSFSSTPMAFKAVESSTVPDLAEALQNVGSPGANPRAYADHSEWSKISMEDGIPVFPGEELRCVLAVVRHGDRTPKQKVKVRVRHSSLMRLLERNGGGFVGGKFKQAKMKTPQQLKELLQTMQGILAEYDLANKGSKRPDSDGDDDDSRRDVSEEEKVVYQLRLATKILQRGGEFHGINRKAQIKPLALTEESGEEVPKVSEALLIIKHGGILTHTGRAQSEELGKVFRAVMYPNHGPEGGGLLRLHSTYRHDLKIYSSDEGRVAMSAAAFAKGLLDLEGDSLVPILVSLVKKDASMLEAFGKGASLDIARAKQNIYEALTEEASSIDAIPASPSSLGGSTEAGGADTGKEVTSSGQGVAKATPEVNETHAPIPHLMTHPKDLLHKAVGLIRVIVEALKKKADEEDELSSSPDLPGGADSGVAACVSPSPTASPSKMSTPSPSPSKASTRNRSGSVYFDGLAKDKPCSGESFMLMHDRWKTLGSSFYKHGKFNASKIPDIYDSVKYDTLHNSHLGLPGFKELYGVAKLLADVVIPNEYGITPEGKYQIASKVVPALVGKILQDLANTREESLEVEGHNCEGEDLGEEEQEEQPTDELDVIQNRLYPEFAQQINSPLRHVRTRVYFTSESHMHALANLLRYATLRESCEQKGPPIVSDKGSAVMDTFSELDYVSHIVIRMFEKKDEPIDSPKRFRIMVLFSPGANSSPGNMSCIPFGSQPLSNRFVVTDHGPDTPGLTLERLVKLLKIHATYRKPANKSKEWTIPMPQNKNPQTPQT